jgi:hypothetical protein
MREILTLFYPVGASGTDACFDPAMNHVTTGRSTRHWHLRIHSGRNSLHHLTFELTQNLRHLSPACANAAELDIASAEANANVVGFMGTSFRYWAISLRDRRQPHCCRQFFTMEAAKPPDESGRFGQTNLGPDFRQRLHQMLDVCIGVMR